MIDLNSRNGTFVDKLPIHTSEVRCGQLLHFGAISFAVSLGEALPESDGETDQLGGDEGDELIVANREGLSVAQRKVFDLLMTGCPEKTIARTLTISKHTVHNHVRAIFRVFGVHSRAELFATRLQQNGKRMVD